MGGTLMPQGVLQEPSKLNNRGGTLMRKLTDSHRAALKHSPLANFRRARILLAAALAFCAADFAWAVPANPEGREVVQPDGTSFILHLRGDEYFSWHETADGNAVVKDESDGFWKYATPAADKAEFRAIRGARVGTADPALLGLKKRALPDAALLRERVRQARKEIQGELVVQPAAGATLQSLSAGGFGGTPQPLVAVSGVKTIKNIVILACFSDQWDSVAGTVSNTCGRVDVGEYSNLFNQVGYNADGAVGSVRDYYREVSYGKLTIQSLIVPWVRLPRERAFYGEGRYTGHPGWLATDAIAAAAVAGFNFSQGDSDGDGWVDALDILHSGYGEEETGFSNDVWSVKGSMTNVVTVSGVKMFSYHTEPALRGSSGTGIERIGTICHETGHFFGLPDLYDYSSLTAGVGNWCLMAGANWNGTSGTSPGHFSAWCKVFLGFAKTVPVHSKTGLSLPRVEDNAWVGMLRDGTTNQEFFLIENRAKVGFDNSTQINPGLLIYHVDQKSANNDLSSWPHPLVKVEEADGNNSLGVPSGVTQAGDAWTSTSGLAGGWRDQTGNTNTTAMLYQSGVRYSRTNVATSYTYNAISGLSAAGSNMTFNVQTLKTDAPTQSALPAPFTVPWAASAQATKYEIQEGSRVTLTNFSDGAESESGMYDNWQVCGKTQCVVTNVSHGGNACYLLSSAGYGAVQALVLRDPFKVTTNTLVSFYVESQIVVSNGCIKCQISNDGGDTWATLSTDSDNIPSWAARSYNYAALSAAGISSNNLCLLRFVVDVEYPYYYVGFPTAGFALDDISISGAEIAGYGNWTTLSNNVTTNAYSISAKTAGVYAYRVQPYANGAWQGYGAVGETTVHTNTAPTWTVNSITGSQANVFSAYSGALGSPATDEVNDVLTFSKVSGPAWLSVYSDGTMSGTPPAGSGGTGTFTVRVTDLAGAYADATLIIPVLSPFANWRLNEAAGPTIYDAISNFNGVAESSLVYTQATALATAGNYAVKFNGSNTWISSIPALNLNTNTVTMTALIKCDGMQGRYPGIFGANNGGGYGGSRGQLLLGWSNNVLACIWSGTNVYYPNPLLTVPTNQWTFVAVAVSPQTLTYYMATNATLVAVTNTVSGGNTNAAFNSTSVIGGKVWGYEAFKGLIDDVAIYGKTLNATQIGQLAAAAFVAAPAASLASPTNGAALYRRAITLSASVVSNAHSIASVRFYDGLTFLGEDTTAPYSFNWSGMTIGSHTVTAKALYESGNFASSTPISVRVFRWSLFLVK